MTSESAIFIGLGANLPSPAGTPRQTLEAALALLQLRGVTLLRLSPWFETAPVPASDQPWYVNAVAEVETALDPAALLAVMHEVEAELGRERRERWEARVVDLDLIDYRGMVREAPPPVLPHPRAAERAFVLLPLAELAPDWRHPVSGRAIAELIGQLPPEQQIRHAQT